MLTAERNQDHQSLSSPINQRLGRGATTRETGRNHLEGKKRKTRREWWQDAGRGTVLQRKAWPLVRNMAEVEQDKDSLALCRSQAAVSVDRRSRRVE